MSIYTIYKFRMVHPGYYMLRRWDITRNGLRPGSGATAASVEVLRSLIPAGLTRRDKVPDPYLEVWV